LIKVGDKSYGEALKNFCKSRKWEVEVEYVRAKIKYVKVGGLLIERMEDCIIDCFKHWAFMDAFATLYVNRKEMNIERLFRENRWKRIPHTRVRVGASFEIWLFFI
jgi:hypothetical protein